MAAQLNMELRKFLNGTNTLDLVHACEGHWEKDLKEVCARLKAIKVSSSFYVSDANSGQTGEDLVDLVLDTVESLWEEAGIEDWVNEPDDEEAWLVYADLPSWLHGLAVTKKKYFDCDSFVIVLRKRRYVPQDGETPLFYVKTVYPYSSKHGEPTVFEEGGKF